MSDAKPYTMDDERVEHIRLHVADDADDARIVATVRALDAAQAENAALKQQLKSAEMRANMAQLDDSKRDELAALKARVAELEAEQQELIAARLALSAIGVTRGHLPALTMALRHQRDEAAAQVERMREELATIQRIAQGDRAPDDALDLVLVATRRALGP